ncbi:MAG: dihydrolipoyl dehydrogenase family protein [Endomicrobiales bacterium]
MEKHFDIVVIGGGPAGIAAADNAHKNKAGVCLIEKRKLGGECTWNGGVASQALITAAAVMREIESSADFGIRPSGKASFDPSGAKDFAQKAAEEVYAAKDTPQSLEKSGIAVRMGTARFVDERTIEVDGEKIRAGKFIVCTGSRPRVPPLEGLADIDYLTNENLFSGGQLPGSLVVAGAGPIGVELSQALQRLGVKVTLVEQGERILPGEDAEPARQLEEMLRAEGVAVATDKKAVRFSRSDGGVSVELVAGGGKRETVSAQQVLLALGRSPAIDSLGLEKAGVAYTEKGITVDEHLRTANENIFACGDAVGPYRFQQVAVYQASICVRNALLRRIGWDKVSYRNVVWAVFTHPVLAHLGLTEEEARREHGDVEVYRQLYTDSDRSFVGRKKEGLVKVITDGKNQILGAHILGEEAAEIISPLSLAQYWKMPFDKLVHPMYVYPTFSELIRDTAAQAFVKQFKHTLSGRRTEMLEKV